MNYYQDILILPNPEIADQVLMATLFMQLHLKLAQTGEGRIGISFPEVGLTPGSRLRLHGTQEDLAKLDATCWHNKTKDYIFCQSIHPVPEGCRYRTVRRVQYKSSAERLRRRSVKKGWLTQEQAEQQISVLNEKRGKLPFLPVKSHSNGHTWLLFIEHGPLKEAPIEGCFSSYGLSAVATVPWF
ncbi:type I-F CRISPR-associated endoribonuclease Cas6/Csy4 [Pantoea piersonii]|uniref:Type I-F CRISPR-associated endoribonuclease Cas6/Csy4 n=1 Tax=Pantoea piersonii TaxID=2364647 RepID=A0AAJ5QJR1_9GAMM|nr:type I-F CRISPR-associated endoribonuclease Cas6/Csy4 [Pantoea piersonii]WBG90375.1 type I-F CRISPR-associated endoribonuclease Cas6/Csy4 [Pantoea piersonii]